MNIVVTGGPVERNSCDFPNFCGLPSGCNRGQKAEEPVLCLISLRGDWGLPKLLPESHEYHLLVGQAGLVFTNYVQYRA